MLKIFKFFVFLFAFIGAFAVAYLAFQFAMSDRLKPTPAETREEAKAEESKPVNPQVAELVEGFKKKEETPAPAPAPPAAGEIAAVSAATTAPVTMSAATASATPLKPIPTPDGKKKLITDWPSGRKWVALTFDDGPHPEWTPKFIELLNSKKVKATFFLVGPNVEKHPEITKAIADSGFELGNHTMTHPILNNKTPDQIRHELGETSRLIKEAAGVDVGIMRPPYGKAAKRVQDVCDELGLKIINWNIDTNDWDSKKSTEETMKQEVMKNLKDGCIVLMHDRYEKTYNTTAYVIDKIREQGYEFVTVSELLGLKPNTNPPGSGEAQGDPASTATTSVAGGSAAAGGGGAKPRVSKLPALAEEAVWPPPPAKAAAAPAGPPAPATSTAGGTQLPAVTPGKVTQPRGRKL